MLLLLADNFVLDFPQIERHGSLPFGLASIRPSHSLVDQPFAVGMAMVTSANCQDLLNIEADAVCGQLALLVVHLDVAISDFVRQENILFEHGTHCALALVNAAPCFDIACFSLSIANNHVNWLFTDD